MTVSTWGPTFVGLSHSADTVDIVDITLPVGPDMLVWPGDPPVAVDPVARLDDGDPANVSALRLGTHTGTHVDPPVHFLAGGATVDRLPLDALVGEAVVADLTGAPGSVGPAELERLELPAGAARLLLKTANSALWHQPGPIAFPDRYVALSADGAAWLVERGVRLVGTDFLSIEERDAPGHPTHLTLLRAGVVILEGLDLYTVEPGVHTLVCLPLRIAGGDGAPARAVLVNR
jgi:arylformamidase